MALTFQLLSTIAVAATLLLLQKIYSSVSQSRVHAKQVWSKLEPVGVWPRIGPFAWVLAIAASITSTRKLAGNGYQRFCKAMGKPFALPSSWTGGALVVVPPSQMPDLLTRPDKLPDSEITNIYGLIETIQLPFVISDRNIYENVLHFDVVRRKMVAKKDINSLAVTTGDEMDFAFRNTWGTSSEWKTVNGWDACGAIIARTAQRILIGQELGRDEKLLEISRQYANSVLLGGALMNCFPPLIRQFVGPIIALRARFYQARCVKVLVPIVEERLRIWRQKGEADDVPNDFLQWMIPTCAKDGADQLDATRIARRLIALLTPLIFATCYVFAHCVLDLHGSPDKDDFLQGLFSECHSVSNKHNGLTSKAAVDSLYRIDSALRESMRTSDVAVVNLFRDVTSGQVNIGNGIHVPQGVRFVFPTQNIHLDPDNYEDPLRYDAFRFSRKYEGLNDAAQQEIAQDRLLITTPTPTFLPFGYGRHACPGRWFAANTMKQALAYIVMNYDVELIGKPIKRQALLNTMVPPVDAKMRIRRKA